MKKKIILGVTLFLMLLTLFALSINAAETIETWDISATSSDNVTATLYDDGSLVISGTGNMKDWSSHSNVPWYASYPYKIKSITIEDGVTTIGNYAFEGCYSLTSVVIGDSVTTIGSRAFYYCDSLTSVVIGDSVTTIGSRAFYYCDSLTSVVIPDSVITIGEYAFAYCDSLTSIVIPDSVTTIGEWAFSSCRSLTIYCEAASKPSGWKYSWNSSGRPVVWGIKDSGILENGFEWVRLSDDTVTIAGYSNIDSEVIIPSTIDGYSVTTIGERAFSSCRFLTSIELPDSVTTIGERAFSSCRFLTSIELPDSVTTIVDYAFAYCGSLTSVVIGNSVTTIGNSAFSDCTSLTSIVIPDSVTTIGNSAFAGCSSLTSVVIGNSVTTIGNSAFSDCTSLTSIVIPDSVTTIGNSAFAGCSSLTSIEVSENNTAYCDIDGNLYTKDKKTLVQYAIGKNDTSFTIPDSVTTIGEVAFSSCDYLTSIVIPDSVTTIGNSAFYSCDALTSVVIPDSVTSMGSRAFYKCTSLTSVVIPDSITTIGDFAFSSCDSLTSIVIPDSVTTIGERAFRDCDSLTIYCEAASQPSGWNSSWNPSNCPVVWGYFDKEASLGEIFTFLGYSFNEEGSMAVGFEINYEALKKYEEKTGETLEIGVVFAGYSLLNGNQPLDNEGNAITLPDGAVVKFDLTEYDYTYYDFVITDIIDGIKDIPLVISAYINNGEENKYIQENGISDTVTGISYNEAKE